MRFGGACDLREAVGGKIASTDATLGDLAARLVSASPLTSNDGSPELGELDEKLWATLAPDVDDAWYELPVDEEVDLKDTSWANRRRYAQGRAKRPGGSDPDPGARR